MEAARRMFIDAVHYEAISATLTVYKCSRIHKDGRKGLYIRTFKECRRTEKDNKKSN
jgi:hypothetical protein